GDREVSGSVTRSGAPEVSGARERGDVGEHFPGAGDRESGSAEPLYGDERAVRLRAGLEHAPGMALDRIAARRADALLDLLAPDTGQHELIVHLEVATGETRLDEGIPVTASTAQRLACDARVRALIKDREGNPLYLGRSHRGVTKTQLAALHVRDR